VKIDQHHERERKIAAIREVARLTGELGVKMYLDDCAVQETKGISDRKDLAG
jgi:hypothetical protein